MDHMHTKVLWAQHTELPAGWQNGKTKHDFYHLIAVYNGESTYYCDEMPIEVTSGHMLLIPPNMVHECPKESHTLMINTEIKFELLNPYIRENLNKLGIIFKITPFTDLALRYVVKCWSSKDNQIRSNVDCILSALLLSLFIDDSEKEKSYSYCIDTSEYDKHTCQIINYIENNYDTKITLASIADHIGLNANYLCNLFKSQTGYTMVEYINYIRIREAARHFYYADVLVIDVALYSGFTNATHFNRIFKAVTGTSPTIFRRFFRVDHLRSMKDEEESPELFEKLVELNVCSMEEAFEIMKKLGQVAIKYAEKNEIKNID